MAVVAGVLRDHVHVGHPKGERLPTDIERVVESHPSDSCIRESPFVGQSGEVRFGAGGIELVEVSILAEREWGMRGSSHALDYELIIGISGVSSLPSRENPVKFR